MKWILHFIYKTVLLDSLGSMYLLNFEPTRILNNPQNTKQNIPYYYLRKPH